MKTLFYIFGYIIVFIFMTIYFFLIEIWKHYFIFLIKQLRNFTKSFDNKLKE
jgi:hypothetical protein